MITETGREAASNTNLLANSRLVTIPVGKVKVEICADTNTAAANYTVSLTLPGGQTPWIDVIVPATNPALTGVLDDRQSLAGVFDVFESGNLVLSIVETGTALLDWRVTTL